MKLISLNVEGLRHHDTVMSLLESEQADVICLQESHEGYVGMLRDLGYQVTFLPRCKKEQANKLYIDGEILASKHPAKTETHYYYKFGDTLPKEIYDEENERNTSWQGIILGEIEIDTKKYHIATTHFTWSPDGGTPNRSQIDDMETLTSLVDQFPSHIMCGDFNIPRGHSVLYKKLTQIYTDNIPIENRTSLDKNLHRLGKDPNKVLLFEEYVVDYVFSQPGYSVKHVELKFGYSDHAAVVATIEKQSTSL